MISINDFYDLVIPRLQNVPYIIYNGTLWSIIVKDELYENDIDIDILIPVYTRKTVKSLFSEFTTLRDDEHHLYLEYRNRRLDCYLYSSHDTFISESSSYVHIADEKNMNPKKLALYWDKSLLFPTKKSIFRGEEINLPAQSEEMLKQHYGLNFRNWDSPEGDSTINGINVFRTVFDHKTKLVYSHKNTQYYYDKEGRRYSHIPTKPVS